MSTGFRLPPRDSTSFPPRPNNSSTARDGDLAFLEFVTCQIWCVHGWYKNLKLAVTSISRVASAHSTSHPAHTSSAATRGIIVSTWRKAITYTKTGRGHVQHVRAKLQFIDSRKVSLARSSRTSKRRSSCFPVSTAQLAH